MTFFASLLLVFVLVVRPQEIWPSLEVLHLLDVLTGLVVLGLLLDLALGKEKNHYTPQLPFLATFVATCYVVTTLALGVGRALPLATNYALIPAIFMFAIMYGAGSLPRLRKMVGLILVLGTFISVVAIHQGNSDPVCIPTVLDDSGILVPDPESADGRVCGVPSDCAEEGSWDRTWVCERIGLFGTMSTGRRVRWRGQLNDPNELSVFIGGVIPLLLAVGLPFQSAASNREPHQQRLLACLAAFMIAVGLYAVILSQSRGGQLVIATVFALLFVSRFGKKGIVLAAILALPVLLLGGRADADADQSTEDRLEILTQGVSLVLAHPIRGVGVDQFADQVTSSLHLTAHNTYLLAAAEVGFPGFFAWTGIAWTSLKIPITALKSSTLSPEIRAVARALVLSFSGIAVGIFFLSFTYKQLLFVWFGMAGAFYRIMKEADPEIRMHVGWKDCAGIALADFTIIGLLWAYTRARGS